ncbi:hypothetical protein KEM60_00471 [Austwickia sp. TVS 96-490-7B]|uniref:ABC transporter substrate-binding protein n=1 Tax=Austwickia sp. TVS 96-490-7B TaxID=2830843 RepID=UPI001DDAEBEB|nr:ABC transporter substrate-binding protein [Austwickia sp. TVS 96-490-7B]MBW3084284.1 hypothetical protein [Austwickia sp. TVS 96-490-7B]
MIWDRRAPSGRRRAGPRSWVAALVCVALLTWSGGQVMRSHGGDSLGVLCSSMEELCRQWAEAFTRHSGIPVSMMRVSSREALARIGRGEGRDEDVWHGGPAELYELARQRGLLAPYVPASAVFVPVEDRDPGGAWTGVYRGNLGFCSNPAMLQEWGVQVPRSWNDLMDPRLRGRVSMPNPATSGTGTTIVGVQSHRLGDPEGALHWLAMLDRQVLQYTRSGMAPAGVVARGEAAVAITFTQHCVRQIEAGRPLVVSYPREGTGMEVGAVAVLHSARHEVWARAYVDFVTSRIGQEIGTDQRVPQLPTRTDMLADARLMLPPDVRLVSSSVRDAAATEDLVARFASKVRP